MHASKLWGMSEEWAQFDDGETYTCVKCRVVIKDYNDGVWVTPIDEDTGEELEDEEETYCRKCMPFNTSE